MLKPRAPVLIGVYSRLSHFCQAIEALAGNYLAEETDLFIASDYPKNESDAEEIEAVRQYIDAITGFKTVTKIYRSTNFGNVRNYSEAIDFIFEKYDRIIIMEDDVVTGRGYLKFINDGLDLYGPDSNVLGVCGYIWPQLESNVELDTLLLSIYCGWGSGFHRANFRKIEFGKLVAQKTIGNLRLFIKANYKSPGIAPLLLEVARGNILAWDVNCFLYAIEHDKLFLFPRRSLVRNIGFDGTGLHCDDDPSFANQIINLEDEVVVSPNFPVQVKSFEKVVFKGFGGAKSFSKGIFLFCIKKYFPDSFFNGLLRLKRIVFKLI